jgi:predicted MFS family arabinose efflux permease
LLRLTMLLATAACFACSVPLSLVWYFAWRLIAGLSGGFIMVLAASVILPHTAPGRRGLVGGIIFTGVGLGVAASGTLVPLLLRTGLVEAWYGLGALSGVLTLVSWWSWPHGPVQVALPDSHAHHAARANRPAVNALFVEYGLTAIALVPHMVFLVDFVARGLGQGLDAGSQYWVLYGIGALAGPLLAGHLADRVGFGVALRLGYLTLATGIVLPSVAAAPAALIISSLVVGACTPGLVPLVLGRVHELIPHDADARHATWGRLTTCFALFQALAAYGYSFLFAQTGGHYLLLFALGGGAGALALVIDLVMAGRRRPRSDPA